eukprot:scaffold7548_cov417-Prasinococcus_capsulatus_cf.AAC.2
MSTPSASRASAARRASARASWYFATTAAPRSSCQLNMMHCTLKLSWLPAAGAVPRVQTARRVSPSPRRCPH